MNLCLPSLHPGQLAIARSNARFKVLACGRRWGKTRLGVALALKVALGGGLAWWVAPKYPLAAVGWRLVRGLTMQIPGHTMSLVDRAVALPGGGRLQVRSAHDPDSLRSEGIDFLVFDEAAYAQETAWTEALRPALSDTLGSAVFISSPNGTNWFYRLWLREAEDWQSWQYPTWTNPYIEPSEIEAARRDLPDFVFRQEFGAEFIADGIGVFRGVKGNDNTLGLPVFNQRYVLGIDWGKYNDFTVLTVLDVETGDVKAVERFNRIDYTLQMGRLGVLVEHYDPVLILAEQNAMGEPLLEHCQDQGWPVEGFVTTNASKKRIIEQLALGLERDKIHLPNDQVLLQELRDFETSRTSSGMLRYSAPSGGHDDTVISLALAEEARRLIDGKTVKLVDMPYWRG